MLIKKKDRNKIKFALVLPSLQPGGMERVMSELANYFSEYKNIEIYLILFGKEPYIFYPLNNKIHILKFKDKFNDKLRIIESVKRAIFIRKNIISIQPQAILSFGTQWNNLILLALWGLKFPIYVSDRGNPTRKYKFTTELLRILLYPCATGIISQTKIGSEIILKKIKKANVIIIGNPIKSVKQDNYEKENIILTIGRLISTKHHDRLIDIFSRINDSTWKLVIVGDNALKQNNYDKLAKQIDKLGLKDRIILCGFQKNIDQFYCKAKIFAFTSSSEGFPNVIGEAMSAGLPVVAYDCVAGPSEMIEDGKNGFLIPLFDDKMFEEKLRYLMTHEEEAKKMGEYARESIKRFSVEVIAEKFYKTLIGDVE